MAFHPLRTFQKNRKFWMASILLVTMITFVLCTGFQGGDFGAWLLNLLRGHSGDEVTRIDGRTIYTGDLDEVRLHRDVANDYMRKATQLVMRELKQSMEDEGKSVKDNEIRKKRLQQYGIWQAILDEKLARPRFFGGGTKLDDLLDFMVWRNQADRLGINLTEDTVRDMVADEMLSPNADMQRRTHWGQQAADYVLREVRGNFYQANYRLVVQALTDEFRVRLARMALEKSPMLLREPNPSARNTIRQLESVATTRMPVTLEQIHDYYKTQRNEAEIVLIPVSIERYLKDVPTPPKSEWTPMLKVLFDKYRERRYDPASVEAGFQMPEQAKVTWVTADPHSKFYKHAAGAATTLQRMPPVLYNPTQPLAMTVTAYAAQGAGWDAQLQRTYENLRRLHPEKYEMAGLTTPYFALPLFKGMTQPKPEQAAALAVGLLEPALGFSPLQFNGGAVGALAGYQAAAYFPQAEEVAPIVQFERKKRGPIGLSIVASGSISPYLAAGLEFTAHEAPQFLRDGGKTYVPMNWPHSAARFTPTGQLGRGNVPVEDNGRLLPPYLGLPENFPQPQPQYLPLLGPVKANIQAQLEENRAVKWARDIMRRVKTRLDAKAGGKALTRELGDLRREFGGAITVGSTEGFRNPYNIGDDPGMEALKKAYEKYYPTVNIEVGPQASAGMLKADDFADLFFGGQPFEVGNVDAFTPRPWPPTVTRRPTPLEKMLQGKEARERVINLWDTVPDVQCFLFWRTESLASRPPDTLADVRPEVEHAWKISKARDLMAAKLKAVTDPLVAALKAGGQDLWTVIRKEAKAQDKQEIKLTKVAPLVERELPGEDPFRPKLTIRAYVPYELPPGKIAYPRDDTAKDILAMRQLKAPLKTGLKGIDDLNKELFKSTQKSGRYIQVLTNRPQTMFYVAVLVQPPTESDYRFYEALRRGYGRFPLDLFVQQAQNHFGQAYHNELLAQLRQMANMTQPSAEAQKRYNQEGPNQ